MHPIERLRWVARAPEGDVSLVVAEAGDALAAFADDPAGLVIACRRLIERRPGCGPMWWLATRVLCALDPGLEAMRAVADLERDPTAGALAAELPGGAVAVVGWPDQAARALRARGRAATVSGDAPGLDRVLVVRTGRAAPGLLGFPGDAGWGCVDWLQSAGVDARLVSADRVARTGRRAVLVLLEAQALGPGGFVAAAGSGALAAAAREAARPVWLVAGVGRALPGPLFDALLGRLDDNQALEVLSLDIVDEVAGPGGLAPASPAPSRPACPVAAELLRFPS